MKNIIVGILTAVVLGLMVFTFIGGNAYHGGHQGKIIADIGDRTAKQSVSAPEEKDDREKEKDAISALREKAGNAGAFKVSHMYKSKWSNISTIDNCSNNAYHPVSSFLGCA